MSRTQRLAVWLYLTAATVYLLDRVSKAWVEAALADRQPVVLIPHVLQLNYTTNSGGAFGLGRSAPVLFASATIVASGIVVWYSFRLSRSLVAIALGMILGGALGNLTDRLAHGDGFFSGRVVDFIDPHIWPVFNVADSAIVIGAILLAIASLRPEET